VFLDGIVDAVPGIVVMTHSTLIAGAWYLRHAPTWSPDIQADQQFGGGAMLSIAELVALPFLLALLFQWARADRVQTAALDHRLDTELALAAAVSSSAAPEHGQAPSPQRVRPWWETEQNEVAASIRRQHRGK
jgi:putative copper resistance protein D